MTNSSARLGDAASGTILIAILGFVLIIVPAFITRASVKAVQAVGAKKFAVVGGIIAAVFFFFLNGDDVVPTSHSGAPTRSPRPNQP